MAAAVTEEHRTEPDAGGGGRGEEAIYKTKTIEFLGRSTPIILQNDNGPCPLLAICNALLLRNSLNLSPDPPEVSLHRLLSLVAEKLIDSNSNVQDKDDGYVTNQQQNIADAIDLLPRLATGIDVNVQFRKINDFEFTRECAIFDLLAIEMYHGWIVDPQDTDTAAAIGSKSYNALVAELVAFETRKPEGNEENIVEDCVDFAAATAAALGVPSPSLSRGISFDECPIALPAGQLQGDREEVELMRALNLSKAEASDPDNVSLSSNADCGNAHPILEENIGTRSFGPETYVELVVSQFGDESGRSHNSDLFESQGCNTSGDFKNDALYTKTFLSENDTISACIKSENDIIQSVIKESGDSLISSDPVENIRADMLMRNQVTTCQSSAGDGPDGFDGCNTYNELSVSTGEDQSTKIQCTEDFTSQNDHKPTDTLSRELPDTSNVVTSGLEGSEPIYEGEERILDSGLLVYEDREPMYEGEMVLAEQADKREHVNSGHGVCQQWQSIKNFLENSASQLTIYGLFCLQESLKERELCVFFRNNHFNTMFKFNGELYLLATDQGYINQPDLVWEKLNEVNGDSVFMTGNFTEFKAENQTNDSWNEQSAMTTTADYLATLEGSSPSSSAMNSDLQLAIALQQQEFEQQPQRHQEHSQQQSVVSSRSRLVTGHQAPMNSNIPQKSESKMKDKCVVM